MTEEAANDTAEQISEELVDKMLDVYWNELQLWNIIGPLEERRTNLPPRPFWNAVRTPPELIIGMKPENTIIHFRDAESARACIQWHGLKAVLVAFIGELAAFASTTEGTPNG